MLKKTTLLVCVLIFQGVILVHAESKIRFAVPNFPPYTFMKGDKFQGVGMVLFEKIMKEVKVPYSLKFFPNHGRAVEETKNNKADGFFLASKNEERDVIAVFSESITINRWSWFLPSGSYWDPEDPKFKISAKIGTHLNTNTHKWLLKNNFEQVFGVPDAEKLPLLMLKRKRFDTVFLAELVFISATEKSGISPNQYKQIVQKAKVFGIYISKDYLSKNPGFMEKLNNAIKKVKKEL